MKDQNLRESLEALSTREPRPFRYGYPQSYSPRVHGYYAEFPGIDGRVNIVPTDGAHVHVCTESGERNELANRGQRYSFHFSQHVYRHPDGSWKLDHPDPEQNLPRNGAGMLYGADGLPRTAVDKLRAAILSGIQAWLAENAAAIEEADSAALNNAARTREEKIREAAIELGRLLDELGLIEAASDEAPRY